MKNFSKGVRWYTKSTVEIFFPEDDVCCARCPLMGMESRSGREYCRKTGELLPAPRDVVGFSCPLEFQENPMTIEKKEKE